MTSHLLISVGVLGVLLDVLLHIAQLFKTALTVRAVAIITILSCVFGGLSLIPQWNLPLLLMEIFVGCLGVYSLLTGKEVEHEGP